MNILFDLGHPAHFHLFKNIIKYFKEQNNNLLITARDKDILLNLLNSNGFDYTVLGKSRKSYVGLFIELMERNLSLYKICRKFKPHLLIGTSVNIAHVGKLIRKKTLIFNEDDAKVVPYFAKLAYPFASAVIKPDCLSFERGGNDIYHKSYHELAYLHPNVFQPTKDIPQKYGLKPYGYSIMRLSALSAHHDRGAIGISSNKKNNIKNLLGKYGIVIESHENELEKKYNINPLDMHHILAFAKILVSDSQTMTAEASVLGIPSVRCNTFVGKISYLDELEYKYGLTYGFFPQDNDKMFEKMKELLTNQNLNEEWQKKRQTMLKDKVDLTNWIIKLIE